jgi:hypothetical protein
MTCFNNLGITTSARADVSVLGKSCWQIGGNVPTSTKGKGEVSERRLGVAPRLGTHGNRTLACNDCFM